MAAYSTNTKIRSKFTALSKNSDTFASIEEILCCIRDGIYADTSVIPNAPVNIEKLSDYILYFFLTGDFQKTLFRYKVSN